MELAFAHFKPVIWLTFYPSFGLLYLFEAYFKHQIYRHCFMMNLLTHTHTHTYTHMH